MQLRVREMICGGAALLFVASCDKPVSTVILDSTQSAALAKSACDNAQYLLDKNAGMISQLTCAHITSCVESTAIVAACGTDIASNVRALETDIASEITGNALCRGVHFVQSQEPADLSKRDAAPHWALILKFAPGQERHAWDMVRSADRTLIQGEGGARGIAQRICAIATGTDAPR